MSNVFERKNATKNNPISQRRTDRNPGLLTDTRFGRYDRSIGEFRFEELNRSMQGWDGWEEEKSRNGGFFFLPATAFISFSLSRSFPVGNKQASINSSSKGISGTSRFTPRSKWATWRRSLFSEAVIPISSWKQFRGFMLNRKPMESTVLWIP